MDARTGSTIAGARLSDSLRRAQWLALLVPAGLLAGALGSQYIGGLNPCEMCYWQRYPHWAAIGLAVLSFLLRSAGRPLVLLAAFAIAVSGAIGVFHAGVELGWWEGLTTCSTMAAGANADELLASIMNTPLVRCDQVQFEFLGISMAGWNAIISLSAAGAIAWLTLRRR